MHQLTTTPFGQRQVTAGLLHTVQTSRNIPALASVDKWALFRRLCTARKMFGVSDRDLTVLNALLSFHPHPTLRADAQLVVFPSNHSLCQRAHGMAESTLRRHLAALVTAGLILRHDSPNGKRYARRGQGGAISHAFGFDLRPLLARSTDIEAVADRVDNETAQLRHLREQATLMRRDATKLLGYVAETLPDHDITGLTETLAQAQTTLRRKLTTDQMVDCITTLRALCTCLDRLFAMKTARPSGCDSQNERHHNRTKKEYIDSSEKLPKRKNENSISLSTVLALCSELKSFLPNAVRNWTDMVNATAQIALMMGIPKPTWSNAVASMGAENAATTIACMLEKSGSIRNPGAYLNQLCKSARAGQFNPEQLIRALLSGSDARC